MTLKFLRRSPTTSSVQPRLATALITAGGIALTASPVALAETNASANWSGYAIHRGGVKFTKVTASWTQPRPACTSGRRSYSAFWVGLGGYNLSSSSLEQIGTEVDCSTSGRARSSAWYELVPAPSRTIRIPVKPGDVITSTVVVRGQRVTLTMYDGTSGRSFRKTIHARSIDTSSAEWIAEAPSECTGTTVCQTLPLADFGSTTFSSASAQSKGGHVGTISDRAWRRSAIRLTPRGRRFVVASGSGPVAGAATPSALQAGGSRFTVRYSAISVRSNLVARARQAALRADHIVH